MLTSDEIVRQRQSAIRRELDRRGIALKALSFDSGLPYATMLSYFPEEGARKPVMISGCAIHALCGKLPADLMSLLLPTGWLIVQVPEEVDHDEASSSMRDYLRQKDEAHHPESENGRDIGPIEQRGLGARMAIVREKCA